MKTGYAVFGFLVVGALAFYVGQESGKKTDGLSPVKAADPTQPNRVKPTLAKKANSDIFNIPVGTASCKGPKDAKVTIIEFSDFQCPFCNRVTPTLKQIEETYRDDVRVCFKQNPLPFHKNAPLAAQAALAAGAQGKFWEMHDKLFANQKALSRSDLESYAQEIGLDLKKFKAALDAGTYKAQIERDKGEAARFGARGTPAFFINGAFLSGAQPFAAFKTAIEDAIKRADAVIAKGVAKDHVYAEVVKNGKTKAAPPKPRQRPGEGTGRQMVPIAAHTPCKGPKNAKVTIVEFSDFQCPFCGRVTPTVKKIEETYKDDVRFCFRNNPLSFHNNAMPAAEAAMAAGAQSKFWEMHDKLFANQKALSQADLERYAKEIGLDMAKFKSAMESHKHKAEIEADQKDAMRFGSRGTPGFFINGTKLSGAQPFERFKALIDADIKKADALIKKGTPVGKVYAELVKSEPFKAAAPQARPTAPNNGKPVDIKVGSAPVKGAKNAKVTIVEFSDFQCPFCGRVTPTIKQLLEQYKGKIKVAFKNNPLPFHNNAEPAAKAALAAHQQGKFWEMHDKLFANQKALSQADLERYAQELGLNMSKFKSDFASPKIAAMVAADKAEAAKFGARGTPNFFVNGRQLVGAQPIDKFKALIDQELKKN